MSGTFDPSQSALMFVTEAKVISEPTFGLFNATLDNAIKDGFVPGGPLLMYDGTPIILVVKYDQRLKDMTTNVFDMMERQMKELF